LHVYYGLLVKNVDYNKIIRVRTNIWNNPPYSPYLCFGLLFGKKKPSPTSGRTYFLIELELLIDTLGVFKQPKEKY